MNIKFEDIYGYEYECKTIWDAIDYISKCPKGEIFKVYADNKIMIVTV